MRSPAVLVIGEVVRQAPGAEERLAEMVGLVNANTPLSMANLTAVTAR